MDQKDYKMLDFMYAMAKQFLDTYEMKKDVPQSQQDKKALIKDNGTMLENGSDDYKKLKSAQDLNGNCFSLFSNEESNDYMQDKRPEEDSLLKRIEETYKDKFPLNFINELQQHSSSIFETETSFSEKKVNNRTFYTFKTLILNTKFLGVGSDVSKKEAKSILLN